LPALSGVLPSQRAVTATPSVLSDGIRCRSELFLCSGTYGDTLFEVCDAVLCRQDRAHIAAELSLEPECRGGHGAV
jgi:hypothetical protein